MSTREDDRRIGLQVVRGNLKAARVALGITVEQLNAAACAHAPFPELSDQDNAVVHLARAAGMAGFWPAFPSAEAQARSTLRGAEDYVLEMLKAKGALPLDRV